MATLPRSKLDAATRERMFERFQAVEPNPKTELDYRSPFELLAAVLLSAQATDVSVNRATRVMYRVASTPQQIVDLGVDGVADHIRQIGLYKTKAKNLVETARLLLERHGGEVPRDRAALEALPGVGRKTANVVLNVAFGEPTVAVDTHIFRVANRTGLAPGATPEIVERGLLARVPDRFLLHCHHWLILHGRYVCKARKPECWHCLIHDCCAFKPKTPAPG